MTGHSNGGGFTYLLLQERGQLLASVSPSASARGRAQRELSHSVEAWDLIARRPLAELSSAHADAHGHADGAARRCCEVYALALRALPTPAMHETYVLFCSERLEAARIAEGEDAPKA